MADLPAAQANAMLNAAFIPSTTYYLGLNTANPGTTGANELTGGGYVRASVTFGSASGGSQASTSSQAFAGLGGPPTVTYFSLWSLVSGGTYLGGGALTTTLISTEINFAIGAINLTVS